MLEGSMWLTKAKLELHLKEIIKNQFSFLVFFFKKIKVNTLIHYEQSKQIRDKKKKC